MANKLQIFNNEDFGAVRVVTINDKEYFVAKDIALSLGYSNPRDAISRHCKGVVKHDSFKKGGHAISLIPEGDIYRLIVRSKLPSAEKFEVWVFDEVLPQIRETGGMVEDGREDEFIHKYFPSFSEEVKLSMVQDLLNTNKQLKPKADYYDSTLQPPNLKTTTDIAKDIGMSAQKLNKKLNLLKIIYPKKVNGKTKGWYLYSEYEHLVPDIADYHINEYGQLLKWTEKGRQFIIDKLEELD